MEYLVYFSFKPTFLFSLFLIFSFFLHCTVSAVAIFPRRINEVLFLLLLLLPTSAGSVTAAESR